jgi:hypothetical protein
VNGVGGTTANNEANKTEVRKRGITKIDYTGRTIPINGDNVSFTDKFIDYAVHVYEIEYISTGAHDAPVID